MILTYIPECVVYLFAAINIARALVASEELLLPKNVAAKLGPEQLPFKHGFPPNLTEKLAVLHHANSMVMDITTS